MAATLPFPHSVSYLYTSSLKDSVVLRCCHSLCKNCLQSYWELNKSLEYPVCLRETYCSVLLHHLSISRLASEGESSQDSNFKPLSPINTISILYQSVEKDTSVAMSTIVSIKTEEDISTMVQMSNLCLKCGMSFKRKSYFRAHEKVHFLKKPHHCSTSGKSYVGKYELSMHMRLHTGRKVLDCSYCKKLFIRESGLKSHLRSPTGEKPFSSSQCGKIFSRRSILNTPLWLHIGTLPHQCNHCRKLFNTAAAMRVNKATHNRERDPFCACNVTRSSSIRLTWTSTWIVTPGRSCSVCGESFLRKQELNTPQTIHQDNHPFHCTDCKNSFKRLNIPTASKCMSIFTLERNPTFVNSGKRLPSSGDHTRHLAVHSDVKSYKCPKCDRSFDSRTTAPPVAKPSLIKTLSKGMKTFSSVSCLLKHRQIAHTDEKPYVCFECGESFNTDGKLVTHQLQHSRQMTHVCSHCGKTFARKETLRRHEKMHSEERPHWCSECGKEFMRSDQLTHDKRN
uniref:Si:ch211-119o8.6 n=1 Tax=Cyprinus carpio TaxID=7962 RepID=A0A8C1TIG8_CYPCA